MLINIFTLTFENHYLHVSVFKIYFLYIKSDVLGIIMTDFLLVGIW